MKRTLCLILTLAMLSFTVGALADTETLPVGIVTELADGQSIDLNGDGVVETIGYICEEVGDDYAYTLTVGDLTVRETAMYLTGRLHAVRMSDFPQEALLFVSDYGMSSDPTSYVYAYGEGRLELISIIDTMPWELTATGSNTLEGMIRGSILQTWTRPCTYVVSTGYFTEDDAIDMRTVSVDEMPRSEYPMGTRVIVNREIELATSRTNPDVCYVLPAGTEALIVATDDIEWLYIAAAEPDYATYDCKGGWLRVQEYGYSAVIDGETVQTSELFEGLLYAD